MTSKLLTRLETWYVSPEQQRSLVERVRAGEPQADEELLRLFGERVRLMMLARTRDPEAARDLTQEVMLAVWRSIRADVVREPERLAAFVHGTARNLASNHVRTARRRPREEPLLPDLPDVAVTDDFDARQRLAVVRAAIERLGPLDRQILLLTLVDGLKPGEIGSRLHLSSERVRARKSRALKKIIEEAGKASREPRG